MESKMQLVHSPEENPIGVPNRKMADQESTRLLSIFPLEIWLIIFDNIFLPEDLHHLAISTDFFHKFLPKTKTLFPEVIKLFSVHFASGKHGKIAPDLLKCRLACRTWQIGVDSFLQSFSNYSNLLHHEDQLRSVIHIKPTDTKFFRPESAAAFLQHFDGKYAAKPGNPFITKSVSVFYGQGYDEDSVSFTKQFLQILGMYGHHIWELGLQLIFFQDIFTPTNIWCYNILREVLQLTPNLKVFKLRCLGMESPTDDEWKTLELNLESCVFPELKNLRYLLMQQVPTPVFNVLLRRYSHVSMLSTHASHPATSDLLMYKHPMPNLDQLAIHLTDINRLVHLDASSAVWPLKTLIMNVELNQTSDAQQLFQFLENRWAATLTELRIYFSMSSSIQVLPSLNLPNLKLFWFDSNIFVPLDFILPMRNSLERLNIRYYCRRSSQAELEYLYKKEGAIKFHQFHDNLMDSNIWQLFPKLHTLDFTHYTDTDDIHKIYCRL